MSNPSSPVIASSNVPPPVLNLPWGKVQADGQVYLNIQAFQFLQTLWASIVGQGGVTDTNAVSTTQVGEISARFLALMDAVGESLRFKAPALNTAPVRKYADDAALLARRPRNPVQQQAQSATFATLPANPLDGQRAFISDGSVVAAGNFGTVAAGGGANHVPCYWDGGTSQWRIG